MCAMTTETTRRDILKGGLAVAGLGLFGIPEWALPALAQGETLVPFTDLPDNINWVPAPDRRLFDVRTIDGVFTPRDKWFTTQHYGHPDIDPAAYRLKVSGMVDRPLSLSLDELKKMRSTELVFGFECSGNRRPIQGLSSNGRWTGVPLREVLNRAGVKEDVREVVFFGADHGDEDVDFRGNMFKVDQQFGRSLPRDKALSNEPILAYALGGEPLTKHQGFPVRLLVPGYYGVCNVKFLSEIYAQHDAYLGKYQARWYRTLRGETINGQVHWKEDAVSHMQLKSWVARVTKAGNRHNVFGIVLNDGTPIKTVEVSVDGGPWQAATLDPSTREKYGWKFFNYAWTGATAGEHTLVSRVIDVNGQVQPTAEEIANKKTFLEDNSQHPRKVMIA
jgi:DMSO/TMAO reductase YedYZ molybdopterin-dependent catalytic subunit